MRIVVFGAGAIGSLVGGLLSKDNEVTLIGMEQHVTAIRENGLQITGKTVMRVELKAMTSDGKYPKPDILFLTVKSYDTRKAVEEARMLTGEGTVIVSLQNGLGNLETIRDLLPGAKIIGGVTSHGAIFVSPGIVEHTGFGDTVLGAFSGCGENEAETIARMLSKAAINTSVTADINREVWYKALVNAAINPLATLANSPNGVLLEDEGLRKLAEKMVTEGVRVGTAHGIDLNAEEAFSRVIKVANQTAENRNSMLQDLERGKRTEIDHINGAIASLGAAVGIDTPTNNGIITKIKNLEIIT
jgi:2-dehydropantoate 2-reductase